jgi:hypothetical protein
MITSAGNGLSCVTFVLAILQSSQIRLVDVTTWPPARPCDLLAQQALIDLLKEKGEATPEHLQIVTEEKGCMRIRPEEMAGAGCYVKWPVNFTDAECASLHLIHRIAQILGVSSLSLFPEAISA